MISCAKVDNANLKTEDNAEEIMAFACSVDMEHSFDQLERCCVENRG